MPKKVNFDSFRVTGCAIEVQGRWFGWYIISIGSLAVHVDSFDLDARSIDIAEIAALTRGLAYFIEHIERLEEVSHTAFMLNA